MAKANKKPEPKKAEPKKAAPAPVAKPDPKPPRFWFESAVFPKGHPQFKSNDPFEGVPCRGNFPTIEYKNAKLKIHGEARIDDPKVIKKLISLGGNLRFDPQEVVDSNLIPFDEVVAIVGPNPFFYENGPTGVFKHRKALVNTQAGEVAPVEEEPDVPIKRLTLMDLDELRELADCFGVFVPAKIGLNKAREKLVGAFEEFTPAEMKEGQAKWNAKKKGVSNDK